MVKNRKEVELLKKLNQISQDVSDNDPDSTDIELCESEGEMENETGRIEFSSSEDEDLCYVAPRRKRARIISDSESENDLDTADRAADGTLWEVLKEGGHVGRSPSCTIFKDVSSPTAYAKRNIMMGTASSAFKLIFDESMII